MEAAKAEAGAVALPVSALRLLLRLASALPRLLLLLRLASADASAALPGVRVL